MLRQVCLVCLAGMWFGCETQRHKTCGRKSTLCWMPRYLLWMEVELISIGIYRATIRRCLNWIQTLREMLNGHLTRGVYRATLMPPPPVLGWREITQYGRGGHHEWLASQGALMSPVQP